MNARPRVKCPECGGNTRKRIGAGAGIIFKGSGFYETDYKRKSNESTSRPASEPAKTESKKEEKKTDTAKED
jgi:predicted nucleic acid-binding Zn ribbon protein